MNNIIGYHHSLKKLNLGDIIFSNQSTQLSFKLVHGIFKIIANELGINLYDEFGYAYCNPSSHIKGAMYKVESSDYIIGNLNYSIYYTMDAMCCDAYSKRWKSTRNLSERIIIREKWLREMAYKYFTKLDNLEELEYISPCWKIIEKSDL